MNEWVVNPLRLVLVGIGGCASLAQHAAASGRGRVVTTSTSAPRQSLAVDRAPQRHQPNALPRGRRRSESVLSINPLVRAMGMRAVTTRCSAVRRDWDFLSRLVDHRCLRARPADRYRLSGNHQP